MLWRLVNVGVGEGNVDCRVLRTLVLALEHFTFTTSVSGLVGLSHGDSNNTLVLLGEGDLDCRVLSSRFINLCLRLHLV